MFTDCFFHFLSDKSIYLLVQLLFREWPNILSLLAGLIAIKTMIITAIGPRVGLTLQESVRIGLLLSQGGEFAFVVFSLANRSVNILSMCYHAMIAFWITFFFKICIFL